MSNSSVLNRFEQASNSDGDNPLVLGGTVETPTGANLKSVRVAVVFTDISTASAVTVSLGVACTFIGLTSSLNTTISADTLITTKIGAASVTDGSLTLLTSLSAVGDVNTATPSADNVLTATDALQILTDGATTTGSATFVAEFELA